MLALHVASVAYKAHSVAMILPRSRLRYPFIVPSPPRLSDHAPALRELEASGHYSNFGPLNTRFEHEVVERLFAGRGAVTTVANATLGLMLAIRHAVDRLAPSPRRTVAILPSFTFAATAHAALWCGLELAFCDVDPHTWTLDLACLDALLDVHGERTAVVIPYATFGNALPLAPYDAILARRGVPVVVDAAASLGAATADGAPFGAGSGHPIVCSMHVTKTFSTGEAGLVYSADVESIRELRRMSNFGFDERREVCAIGLNAKLSEHGALLCLAMLDRIGEVVAHRNALHDVYVESTRLEAPRSDGFRGTHQFFAAALPRALAPQRDRLVQALATRGVEARTYFAPPLHLQRFFSVRVGPVSLPATEDLARRVLSLPLHDGMSADDVRTIAAIVDESVAELDP